MPSRPVPVALLVAALLLIFAAAGPSPWSPAALGPAAATAQSAGDDQYDDPFAGQGGNSSSGHSSAPQQVAPTSTPAPAPAATAAPAPTAAAAQQDELPRTGAEPLLIAIAGLALVLAGVALRLRLHGD